MRILALLLALASAGSAADRAEAQVRAEVPIRVVVLSDGARRYAVPITVGGTAIEAGLDTGSSGLRILPGVLADSDARPGSQGDSYAYGSGAKLAGVIGSAVVAVGGIARETKVQLIRTVGCTPNLPRCPASRVALADYGIQGDGLMGEGFKAILGINMADAKIPSLFSSLGVRRWIVDLPRPGEGVPGRIVLNPTDGEVADYARLHVLPQFGRQPGGLHDAVAGCLKNMGTGQTLCGAVLMDCGAPGVTVEVRDTGPRWPAQTPASLILAEAGNPVAAATFETDQRAQASHLTFRDGHDGEGNGPQAIYAGLLPYFAWSVLYDPAAGVVGVKPRPPAPGGPVWALAR
ncbi:hypothetical protein BH09PSE2_BH09PSE2_24850 [soil metagenome]